MQDGAPRVGLPSKLSVEEMGLCPFGLDPKVCQLLAPPLSCAQDEEEKDEVHAPSNLCIRKGGVAQIDKDAEFGRESRVFLD